MALSVRPRMKIVLLVAVSAGLLLGVGLPLVIFTWVQPPPGPSLASLDIRSGQPFQVRFISDGREPRVWLDMECQSCSFPVTGKMTLTARGKTIMSANISAGNSRDRAWGGTNRALQQHLLFDAPEQPSGTVVTIDGALQVGPARSNWSTAPVKGAPPPKIKVFRLTVAP